MGPESTCSIRQCCAFSITHDAVLYLLYNCCLWASGLKGNQCCCLGWGVTAFPTSFFLLCNCGSGLGIEAAFFPRNVLPLCRRAFQSPSCCSLQVKGNRTASGCFWIVRPKPFAMNFHMQAVHLAKQTFVDIFLSCRKEKKWTWKCQINSTSKSSNGATSRQMVICIEEAFAGGFPVGPGSENGSSEAELTLLNSEWVIPGITCWGGGKPSETLVLLV